MKDIPVFSCPDGIATLILREVPFRGEGYILVRGVFGTLEGLLAECAGFCRAAGAERLFAAGEADFSGYPAAIRILGRSAPRESLLPAPEAVRLVPRHGGNGSGLGAGIQRPLPGRACSGELQPGGGARAGRGRRGPVDLGRCGAHRPGRVRGGELLAVAALQPGAGERCVRALAAQCTGPEVRLTCAEENGRAMRLYDRLGFSHGAEERVWFSI